MLCLTVPTDEAWARDALRDVDGVLVDHAHCEMKAASNALSLAARYPHDLAFVLALTDLAREEIDHFRHVVNLLVARGVPLGTPPVDVYAAQLRRILHELPRDRSPLVDRLLVCAVIEARSCERFRRLSDATAGVPARDELHALWTGLVAAEARHYRTFIDLAVGVAGGDRERVIARLDTLAAAEGALVAALASRPDSRATIHG